MPSRYAIQFAFDGTDYCGWQKQNGVGKHANPKPSIEETVVDAIAGVCGEIVTVVASGRTDAGVHSNGQVAHFSLSTPRETDDHFADALNARLPGSIRILRAGRVADSFKAQRAVKKQYSYYFQQGPANLPQLRNTTMWNRRSLDVRLMHEAAQHLVGKHDFLPFCGAGAKVKSTVREIFEASATEAPLPRPGLSNLHGQSLICVRLVGSGFLKHMIRIIAGTLKQIGEEMRPPEEIATILTTQDKSRVGPTAPASGLWLDRVWYDDGETPDFLK